MLTPQKLAGSCGLCRIREPVQHLPSSTRNAWACCTAAIKRPRHFSHPVRTCYTSDSNAPCYSYHRRRRSHRSFIGCSFSYHRQSSSRPPQIPHSCIRVQSSKQHNPSRTCDLADTIRDVTRSDTSRYQY